MLIAIPTIYEFIFHSSHAGATGLPWLPHPALLFDRIHVAGLDRGTPDRRLYGHDYCLGRLGFKPLGPCARLFAVALPGLPGGTRPLGHLANRGGGIAA